MPALLFELLAAWLIRALRLEEPVDPEVMRPPDEIVACEARLNYAGVSFSPSRIPIHASPAGFLCGAPQVVRYIRGPGDIDYNGRPKMTCPLALAMADFELVLQAEARAHLGSEVESIRHVGTYNCREMAAYDGWVSEHSYANGIDIKSLTLADGRVLTIRTHYLDEGPEGEFLRALTRRLYDEAVFSVIVTPAADGLHKHHLHFDMAHYRFDGT